MESVPTGFAAKARPKIITGTNYSQDILDYSPFDLPGHGHRIEQLSSGSYIVMPGNGCTRLITAEKQVVFYYPSRDTWELGPTHNEADCIEEGYPLGKDIFLLNMIKIRRMRGFLGILHRFFDEPNWDAGTWDESKYFWCLFDAKKKEFLNCMQYDRKNVRTMLCDVKCSDYGYQPDHPKINLYIYPKEDAWQFEWKTPESELQKH
jgi:hypothetical protein